MQVGVGAIGLSEDPASPELAAGFADDAHRSGEIRDRLAVGPRVHAG